MVKTIRLVLLFFICLLILLMVVLVLPSSRHETIAYTHAFVAFHDAPSDSTRKALAQIIAEEDHALIKTELILGVPLAAASVGVGVITRRLRMRTI